MKSTIQRPKKTKVPPTTLRVPKSGGVAPLLPHERDEFVGDVEQVPDVRVAQAKRDLDAGIVDTDMRATPGLDAARRAALVPGPGGKPLSVQKPERN